ncbi:MAG TPA: peptidyl-prolyl cis-trans isomerase [Planctomycetes bacterium]|nr:peptidyl-prolyl cis-trans isomerase [Planctomycetota bacterium]
METNPVVNVDTTFGVFSIELWSGNAPETVENFLRYVDEKFYDGTIFHRVINGFMIQGGGFTFDLKQKPTRTPIRNEARAEVKNLRGTVAMARTSVVDSATAQFFINLSDNDFLDHKNMSARGFGYAVFGRVVEGMDVVDRIAKTPTTTVGEMDDVPVETVVITSIRRAEQAEE